MSAFFFFFLQQQQLPLSSRLTLALWAASSSTITTHRDFFYLFVFTFHCTYYLLQLPTPDLSSSSSSWVAQGNFTLPLARFCTTHREREKEPFFVSLAYWVAHVWVVRCCYFSCLHCFLYIRDTQLLPLSPAKTLSVFYTALPLLSCKCNVKIVFLIFLFTRAF